MNIKLTLFGTFHALDAKDQPIQFRTQKVRALLVYLFLESDRPHSRLRVASLLWSDVPEAKAMANLRQTLFRLKQNLQQIGGDELIVRDRQTLQVMGDGKCDCDVDVFEQLIRSTKKHNHDDLYSCMVCQSNLAKAIGYYRAELLQGFHINDAGLFENWLLMRREALHLQAVAALQALLRGHFQRRDYDAVIMYARRLLGLEPLKQSVWRQLMLALEAKGDRWGALTAFERCRKLFAKELGAEPPDELAQLYESLKSGRRDHLLSLMKPYKGLHTFGEADAPYFFGREAAVRQLVEKLDGFGFVSVVAPSGSGKSSLVAAGLLPKLRQQGWRITVCRPGNRPMYHLEKAIAALGDGEGRLLVVDQFEELYAGSVVSAERQSFLQTLLAPDTLFSVVITLRADFIGDAINHRPLADALQTGSLLLGPMNESELRRAIKEPAHLHGVTFEGGLVTRLLHDVGKDSGHLPLLQFTLLQLWESRENNKLTHIAYESMGRLDGALAKYAESIYTGLNKQEQIEAQSIFLQLVQSEQHVEDMRRVVAQSDLTDFQWKIVQKLANARLLVTSSDGTDKGNVELVHEVLIRYWNRFQEWLTDDRNFRTWLGRVQLLLNQWRTSGRDEGALLRGIFLSTAERWQLLRDKDIPTNIGEFINAAIESRQQGVERIHRQQQREYSQKLALEAQLALFNNDPSKALSLALTANTIDHPHIISQRILSEAAYAPGTQRIYQHHKAAILDIAVTPDESLIATASVDGTLLLWDRDRSKPIASFDNAGVSLSCLDFTHDGTHIIAGDVEGNIWLWPILTKPKQRAAAIRIRDNAHKGQIRAIVSLPDCAQFISAGDDHIVRLWSVDGAVLIHEFVGHTDTVHCLDINSNGNYAVSGSADHGIFVWDILEKKVAKHLVGVPNILPLRLHPPGNNSPVFGVKFMPDDKQIISVSDIGSMYLWQWQTGEITKRYHPNIGLRQVDICADGKKALVGTIDSQLILIDLQTSDIIMRLKGHAGRVDTVYLGEHANTAFSGASDGELRLWDLNNGAIADHIQISGEVGYIASFDLSMDGRTGLFGFMSGKMALWSRGTNEFLHRWQGHNDMLSGGVAFSLDGNLAVSGSGDFFGKPIDNAICVWDLRRGERLFQFHGHTSHVRGVAFAPNQQFVLSAGFDGTVRYGSLVDGSERILLNVSPQGVLSVAILPDGNRAIIGLGQGNHLAPDTDVIMLDIETGDIIRRFQGHSEGVMGLAIALDGSFFLSGGFDNTVRMWDVETGECRQCLIGHQGNPSKIAISPSGRFAVSGGYDTTLHLWDLERGGALRRWPGRDGYITSVHFLADGLSVLTTALDNSIRTWRLDESTEVLLQWIGENRHIPVR